jgi:hypothetical protein
MKNVTVVEALIVIIIGILLVAGIWGIVKYPDATVSIKITDEPPPPEVPRVTLSALLCDKKGRTVPAEVLVAEEDLPKLVQGHTWKILIQTDDPRWNLQED